jgi:hypothetical protein
MRARPPEVIYFPRAMTEAAAAAATVPSPPLTDRVKEFFTLESAERAVKALPEGPRATAHRELALSFQKRDAAETLWPRGSCAEALKLARASLDVAASALESFAGSLESRPSWIAEAQATASAAREKATARALPDLESDARPEDEETFRALIDAGLAIQRIAAAHLAGEGELKQLRRSRVVTTVFATAGAIALLAWALHTPDFKAAIASGQQDTDYSPDKAIDGDTTTNWYLANGQLGWIELTPGRPGMVKALRMMAINPPWHDRGLKEAHLRCSFRGAVTKETDLSFPVPQARGTATGIWTDVPIGAKCDQIRIEAKSFYGQGVGIAEVELK